MWSASIRSIGVDTTRLGVISPNRGNTSEATFTSAVPEGVSLAFTGLGPLPRIDGSIVPALREVGIPRVPEAAEFLGTLGCDVVCMSGSIVGLLEGPGFAEELADRMESAAGLPVTTTSAGIASALDELDAERVAVVTSYDPTTLGVAVDGLTELGFDLEPFTLDRRGSFADDVQLSTDRIYRFTRRSAREATDPDCVLMLGGSIPSLPLIEDLEGELDVPVVSDGQATLFGLFRQGDVGAVEGHGELLRRV